MRGFLFRAKRKDNGKWVEGYYAKAKDYLSEKDMHVIFPLDLVLFPRCEFSSYEEIVPETLGRRIEHPCYDGTCTDQRFFQGDIIEVHPRRCANAELEKPGHLAIIVDEHCISENGLGYHFPQDTTQIKIVGNVHDNPELVGKKCADLYKYYHCLDTLVTREDLEKNR